MLQKKIQEENERYRALEAKNGELLHQIQDLEKGNSFLIDSLKSEIERYKKV